MFGFLKRRKNVNIHEFARGLIEESAYNTEQITKFMSESALGKCDSLHPIYLLILVICSFFHLGNKSNLNNNLLYKAETIVIDIVSLEQNLTTEDIVLKKFNIYRALIKDINSFNGTELLENALDDESNSNSCLIMMQSTIFSACILGMMRSYKDVYHNINLI